MSLESDDDTNLVFVAGCWSIAEGKGAAVAVDEATPVIASR